MDATSDMDLVEVCMAELVQPRITGADLDYQGSITIDQTALTHSDLFPGQMVRIDNVKRPCPSWRTYIVPGEHGGGDIIMNGPPAHHFKKGDPVTIRGSIFISGRTLEKARKESGFGDYHTVTTFCQDEGTPNRMGSTHHFLVPDGHYRRMCISKLHRIVITGNSSEGHERLVVDADILEAAGFPAGLEVQFTSLGDGVLRRTCVQAGPRGSGIAEIHGAAAQYVPAGTRIITLAESILPREKAGKLGGPQVVFFDESRNDRNVIRDVKCGGHAPRTSILHRKKR